RLQGLPTEHDSLRVCWIFMACWILGQSSSNLKAPGRHRPSDRACPCGCAAANYGLLCRYVDRRCCWGGPRPPRGGAMQSVLLGLAALACPVGMGLMMWLM